MSWVALAYLLGVAAFMPIFAQLCQIFGRKLLYIIGFVVFTGASALCGFAPDLPTLIAFRFLQGFGGAMLGANSMALVVTSTDKSLRARALGVYAGAQAVGISAGPVIGGVLLGTLGWPWVFWINVPFGLIAIAASWFVLPVTAQQNPDQRFDWRGGLLLAPALAFAVLALNQVSAWGLTSPALLGTVGAAIVLIFLFVRQEHGARSPLIDLALLDEPAFLAGALACALSYAMLYGMFFLASFALVRGYEESAVAAGFKLAIIPISLGIVAPFAGGLADRIGDASPQRRRHGDMPCRLARVDRDRDAACRQSLDRGPRPCGFRGGPRVVHCAEQPRDDQCGAGQSFRRRWRVPQSDAHSRHCRGRRQRVRDAVLAATGRARLDRAQACGFLAPSFRRGGGGPA